jgi:putative hydrolase of the HAD superfamily
MMFVSDLDDTIYPEVEFVHSGFRAIGAALEQNGVISAADAVATLRGAATMAAGIDALAARIAEVDKTNTFNVRWMVDCYRYHKPDIKLSDEVERTLTDIAARGIVIGLITDGRSLTQRAKIEALQLQRFIAPGNIIISEEIGGDKTTAIPFRALMAANPNERQFLYLGDNPAKDFFEPNRMGWLTVELADIHGTNIHPQPDAELPFAFRAAHRITAFSQVLSLLH